MAQSQWWLCQWLCVRLIVSNVDGIGLVLFWSCSACSEPAPFSTYWNVNPCLHSSGVGIVQFFGLLHSFSNPIVPHPSDVLVEDTVTTVSVLATASVALPQVLLSRFSHVATPTVSSGHPTTRLVVRTIVVQWSHHVDPGRGSGKVGQGIVFLPQWNAFWWCGLSVVLLICKTL